jgi:hypothetical protein
VTREHNNNNNNKINNNNGICKHKLANIYIIYANAIQIIRTGKDIQLTTDA